MGFSWSAFGHIAQILAPIVISTINPKLSPIAGAIGAGIAEAEQIPGAKGPDKLQHVVAIANDAATSINSAAGKQIVDPTNLNEAATEAVDTTVAVINLVHPAVVANVAK